MKITYLTNGCCENTGHVTGWTAFDAGPDFYPLTEQESRYISEIITGLHGTEILGGYSALIEGYNPANVNKKFFTPTIESAYRTRPGIVTTYVGTTCD
jgi:hypothetical protein